MKIFVIFVVLYCLAALGFSKKPPRWDPNYIVNGTLYIPHAEIEEPFHAWYDENTKRSRIDYYGGMVKTYQLADKGDYGTSLKLAPVTMKDKLNKETCFQVNGTAHNIIEIQPLVPFANHYEFIATEMLLGFTCDKFQSEEMIEQGKKVLTIWVRKENLSSQKPIPVRYEIRAYNTLLGSLRDHYYFDYDSYKHETIPNEVFELENGMTCTDISDPDSGHFATLNPMKEFMEPAVEHHVDDAFHLFKHKHGVEYNSDEEHGYRKNIFRQNLRYIQSVNRANLNYTLAVNYLADRTVDEIRARLGYRSSGPYESGKPFIYNIEKIKHNLTDEYDWRRHGAVTPVKDQSACGSCWSFAAIGCIEGAYFLKNGQNLVHFSEQALIDCSWEYGNDGCEGGNDFHAYQWMMQVGGVPTEEEYGPYLMKEGFCHIRNVSLVAPIKGFVKVTPNDPMAFKIAMVTHGPLSVAIDASPRSFSFYSHGVYYEPTCKNKLNELNHAVLAVGYGSMNGENFWLIKNSWSTNWGSDGYILMSARQNTCGVMTQPMYVEM